ncbi:MAG: Zn-dependent exopeptidase M28 [Treponema sp.]|jgi:hypothetical protein|nr:Zn-dependent exopeptidase M28 [Treponema sp.]
MKPRTANRDWTGESPYERFFDFIAPGADRYTILLAQTEKLALNSVVIPVNGNSHFFIFPRERGLKPSAGVPFRGQSPAILVAHYDRAAGSPGANDNSAAVFQLLKAAIRLGELGADYWIVIFTDKEELGAGEGIRDQGSFALAEKLRTWGLGDARVFNFDACGTGDTFVISSTTDYLLKNDKRPGIRKAKQLILGLRDHALDTARYLGMDRVLLAPTPFSDDAGFLRAGIPAQTVTVLPAGEAGPYASLLRKRPEFADSLISGKIRDNADRLLIPETWRCLNGPSDSHLRLTPEFYDRVVRFAVELCRG